MPAAFASIFEKIILASIHLVAICAKPVLALRYLWRTKRLPFFIVPRTINEKYLWRKLFDHNPVFIEITDKLACKDFVRKRSPKIRIAKVLKVIEHPDQILELSDSFLSQPWVLKSSGGCGDSVIMPNGCIDKNMLFQKVQSMFLHQHGRTQYEWAYLTVQKKVFFEEYINPEQPLREIKVYTFGSKIGRIVQIGERFDNMWAQAWELTDDNELIYSKEPAIVAPPKKDAPFYKNIKTVIDVAKQLGKPFDHMRVDLLTDGKHIWLGELTVYNMGGYHSTSSGNEINSCMNKKWNLNNSYAIGAPGLNFFQQLYRDIFKRQFNNLDS